MGTKQVCISAWCLGSSLPAGPRWEIHSHDLRLRSWGHDLRLRSWAVGSRAGSSSGSCFTPSFIPSFTPRDRCDQRVQTAVKEMAKGWTVRPQAVLKPTTADTVMMVTSHTPRCLVLSRATSPAYWRPQRRHSPVEGVAVLGEAAQSGWSSSLRLGLLSRLQPHLQELCSGQAPELLGGIWKGQQEPKVLCGHHRSKDTQSPNACKEGRIRGNA